MNEERSEKALSFCFYCSAIAAACLYTLLDWFAWTIYITYVLPAILFLSLPTLLSMAQPKRSHSIVLGGLIVWFTIVPYIRWDYYKSFFVDCWRLRTGMELVQVLHIMKPYYSHTEVESPNQLRFKPGEGGGDNCLVKIDDGKVVDIEILVD